MNSWFPSASYSSSEISSDVYHQQSKTVSFETGHEEMIHDAQLDYYGKRLATCSSDRSIRIFDVHAPSQQTLTSQIRGHEGPVWQVGWAHPKFGSILASCSYDGRVCVWKEQAANNWIKIYEYSRPEAASINSLQFAPHSFGLALAVGSADGTVSVLTRKADNTWDVQAFPAHKGGVNSVSWGPDVKSGSLLSQQAAGAVKFDRKLLTGGCDNQIRLWRLNEENNTWYELRAFQEVGGETAHSDWVRDAAFAPSLGLPSNTIASASEDKTVCIWVEDPASGAWRKSKTLKFDTKVYRVSWSLMGNILAVAQGDNKVSLWKESIEGDWKNLSQAQAAQIAAAPASAYPGAIAPPSPAHAAPADHFQQQQQQQHQQQQQVPQGHYQPQVPQQQQQAPPQMYQQQAPHQYQQPQQQQYGMPQQPQQPQYGMPQQGMYGHPQGNPTAF